MSSVELPQQNAGMYVRTYVHTYVLRSTYVTDCFVSVGQQAIANAALMLANRRHLYNQLLLLLQTFYIVQLKRVYFVTKQQCSYFNI